MKRSDEGFFSKYISSNCSSSCVSKSLLEDKPPKSKRGSLKPPYSQSTTQILEPSSKKFAAKRSLWPKTMSLGEDNISNFSFLSNNSLIIGKWLLSFFIRKLA